MSPKEQTSAKSKVQKPSRYDGWTVLSWADLAEWAGSRSVGRGRTYQKQGLYEYAPSSPYEGFVCFEVHIWTAGMKISAE
jgi:hypothetical protein